MLISETKSKFMLLIFSILKPAPEIFCGGKKRKELDKKKKQKEKDKTNRRKRQRKSIRIFLLSVF